MLIMQGLRSRPCDVLACARLAFSGRWGWIFSARTPEPPKLSDLVQALRQGTEEPDQPDHKGTEEEGVTPRCPHCGSAQTRLLGEWSRSGVPRVS